jgi:peptidoglycan hydrolase-like protein with peptidoglycan-binding domain
MIKKTWLCYLAAVLFLSAAPAFAQARKPASKHTSTPTAKKKTAKTKKKAKPRVAGQQSPTPDRIREIQSALNREGALGSEPTGKWDGATVSAMQKFQTNHDLAPTGKVDALTLQKLGLGSDIAGKGAPTPAPGIPASTSRTASP